MTKNEILNKCTRYYNNDDLFDSTDIVEKINDSIEEAAQVIIQSNPYCFNLKTIDLGLLTETISTPNDMFLPHHLLIKDNDGNILGNVKISFAGDLYKTQTLSAIITDSEINIKNLKNYSTDLYGEFYYNAYPTLLSLTTDNDEIIKLPRFCKNFLVFSTLRNMTIQDDEIKRNIKEKFVESYKQMELSARLFSKGRRTNIQKYY